LTTDDREDGLDSRDEREERVVDEREREDSDIDPDLREDEDDRDRAMNTWSNRNVHDANQIANDKVLQDDQETAQKLDSLLDFNMPSRKDVCRNIQERRLSKVKNSLTHVDIMKYCADNPSMKVPNNADQLREQIAIKMLAKADAQAAMDYRASLGNNEEVNFLTDLEIRDILLIKHQQRKAKHDKKRKDRRVESILDNLRLFTIGAEVPQKKPFAWETRLREQSKATIPAQPTTSCLCSLWDLDQIVDSSK
jgi:hypothetical protein